MVLCRCDQVRDAFVHEGGQDAHHDALDDVERQDGGHDEGGHRIEGHAVEEGVDDEVRHDGAHDKAYGGDDQPDDGALERAVALVDGACGDDEGA